MSALRCCSSLLSTELAEEQRLDLLAWQMVLLLEMGHQRNAGAVLQEASQSTGLNRALQVAKAYYEFLQGQMDSSCSVIDSALSDTYDWLALYVGTFYHAHLLETEKAISLIERWNTCCPDEPLVLRRSYELLQALGHGHEAGEYRSLLLRQKPASVHAFIAAAEFAKQNGRLDSALQECRAGIDCFGMDDELWSLGAFCLLGQHFYEEAVEWALHALQLNERNYTAYLVLESCAEAAGNASVAQALRAVRRALRADMPALFAPLVSLVEKICGMDTQPSDSPTPNGSYGGSPLVRRVLERALSSGGLHRVGDWKGDELLRSLQKGLGEGHLAQDFLGCCRDDTSVSAQRELLLRMLVQAVEAGEEQIAARLAEVLQSTLSPEPLVGITEILSLLFAGLVDEAQKLASAYADAHPQVKEYKALSESLSRRVY